MIAELEQELRRLLRGLNGQTALFLGCFGVLLAQMLWVSIKGALPVPDTLPLFTGLAATLALHSHFLSQRGLLIWLNAVDQRLGRGSGWALLETAMLGSRIEKLDKGVEPGAGEFEFRRGNEKLPTPLRRALGLAIAAPLLLAFAALVFTSRGLSGAAMACAAGTVIGCAEALSLRQLTKFS